jgi:hypothetical protein
MKFFNWLELTQLELTKPIGIDGSELKFPITLNRDGITEIEYKAETLSKKVFSFCLYFKYYKDNSYVLTYILGLLFNYRLLLFNKKRNPSDDYKFRVYIDKKSFYSNKDLFFYLSYLKFLEMEILKSKKINYEWLELILCEIKEPDYNKSMLMCFRFIPLFEGCEFHSRDLDYRFSTYDYELINIYNNQKYPLYFCSSTKNGVGFNPFLGGCWGGNINKLFSIRSDSSFNEKVLKFFTPKAFIAICLIYNNLFNITFGIDELILRFYVDLLSDTYIDNCMVFGKQFINIMSCYMAHQYICTNKIQKFDGMNLIYGYNFFSRINMLLNEPNTVFCLVTFKFDELATIYNIKTIVDIYDFINQQNNNLNFFNSENITGMVSIVKNIVKDLNAYLNGESTNYFDSKQLEIILNMENMDSIFKISEYKYESNIYKSCELVDGIIVSSNYTKVDDQYIPYDIALTPTEKIVDTFISLDSMALVNKMLKAISFNFEKLLLSGNVFFGENTEETIEKISSSKFDPQESFISNNRFTSRTLIAGIDYNYVKEFIGINKIVVPPYVGSQWDVHIEFAKQLPMTDLIDKEMGNEDINIISIPVKSKIMLSDNSLVFDINYIPADKEFDCKRYVKKDIESLKLIYFTGSKIVFSFIFDSIHYDDHVRNRNNICGFGDTFTGNIGKLQNKCGFFTANYLKIYDSNGVQFYPFGTTGGKINYYHKYIKYKNKYLSLKKN